MGQEFPFHLPYDDLDLRERPDLYRIGKGEQGVLSVQPYKREILPHCVHTFFVRGRKDF